MKAKKNKRGITVKKGCISCKWKMYDGEGNRICTLFRNNEKGYCNKWRMTQALRNAGTPYGTIHTKPYLRYAMEIAQDEQRWIAQGYNITPTPIEEMRNNYLKEHKTYNIDF